MPNSVVPKSGRYVTGSKDQKEEIEKLLDEPLPEEGIERIDIRKKDKPRDENGRYVSETVVSGLEREQQREILARVTPRELPPSTKAIQAGFEAQRQAQLATQRIAEQAAIYQENVQAAEDQIKMLQDSPGSYTLDGKPVKGEDIDRLKRELAEYKQEFKLWVSETGAQSTLLREKGKEVLGEVRSWSDRVVERDKANRRAKQEFNQQLQQNIGFGTIIGSERQPILETGPTTFNQAMLGVLSLPSDILTETSRVFRQERVEQRALADTAKTRGQTRESKFRRGIEFSLAGVEGFTLGLGTALNPVVLSQIPAGLFYTGYKGAEYLTQNTPEQIRQDLSSQTSKYLETIRLNPARLSKDVGYQLGMVKGYETLIKITALTSKTLNKGFARLPREPSPATSLAKISGSEPLPFKQMWEIRTPIKPEIIEPKGLATISGAPPGFTTKQLIELGLKRGITSEVIPAKGLATYISEPTYIPTKQFLELLKQKRVSLPREFTPAIGLAQISGETPIPFKQAYQVARQKFTLPNIPIPGELRFLTIPSREYFTVDIAGGVGFPGKPGSYQSIRAYNKDLSNFFTARAQEAAKSRADSTEQFMTKTFKELETKTVKPAKQTDVRQLISMSRQQAVQEFETVFEMPSNIKVPFTTPISFTQLIQKQRQFNTQKFANLVNQVQQQPQSQIQRLRQKQETPQAFMQKLQDFNIVKQPTLPRQRTKQTPGQILAFNPLQIQVPDITPKQDEEQYLAIMQLPKTKTATELKLLLKKKKKKKAKAGVDVGNILEFRVDPLKEIKIGRKKR